MPQKIINVEKRRIIPCIVVLLTLVNVVSATTGTLTMQMSTEMAALNTGLVNIAAALGVLVISYAGLRWIMSTGPQEREDAKKTVIYAIIGLLVVSIAYDLVDALYVSGTPIP